MQTHARIGPWECESSHQSLSMRMLASDLGGCKCSHSDASECECAHCAQGMQMCASGPRDVSACIIMIMLAILMCIFWTKNYS